jgi:transposase
LSVVHAFLVRISMTDPFQKQCGKCVSAFETGQIVSLQQAGKSTREMSQITVIGLRTVQRIIAKWKMAGKLASARQNCGRAKMLDDRYRRSLKRLVKSNMRSPILQLSRVFNQGARTISTPTVRRELKEMSMKSCVATRMGIATIFWPSRVFWSRY